ncbi:MAG: hypothetical protein AMJ88_14600 [Anaerolineae bacterium SM23_ 63]|nr:MAG: hypothetical protein AMJ88_14600 [Anaerolineae bacterium SM23_ 63]
MDDGMKSLAILAGEEVLLLVLFILLIGSRLSSKEVQSTDVNHRKAGQDRKSKQRMNDNHAMMNKIQNPPL